MHVAVARYLGFGKTDRKPGEAPQDSGSAMEQLALVLGPPQQKFRPPVRMLEPAPPVQTPAPQD